jgi:mono/diheme cytochrome c family protein
MPRYTARERRERYLREYEFQKRTGKQFFPYAIFHDAITSVIVVGIIIAMAVYWKLEFGSVPTDASAAREGGLLGPAYESRADPAIEGYDPKPEWYFFFLFELLKIFKTPELLIVGSVIIPTLMMMALIALPFIDRRPERRVSRRPVAMAVGVAIPIVLLTLTWRGDQGAGIAGETSNRPGSAAFAQTLGCGTCHKLADAGTAGNVGPVLDDAQPDFARAVDFITNGRGAMPAFKDLGEDQINCIAGYVATWSGAEGETPGPQAASAEQAYPAACEAAGGEYAGGEGGTAAPAAGRSSAQAG